MCSSDLRNLPAKLRTAAPNGSEVTLIFSGNRLNNISRYSFSGNRADTLILGVGGSTGGSGSGCTDSDLSGGKSMGSGVEFHSSLLSILVIGSSFR